MAIHALSHHARQSTPQAGFSLVELMLATALGLMLCTAIITLFLGMRHHDQIQQQQATLSANTHFALATMRRDLARAGGSYCHLGAPVDIVASEGTTQTAWREPVVLASPFGTPLLDALHDVTTRWGAPYPQPPNHPYSFPEFLTMRGYDCGKSACHPMDPHDAVSGIPAAGTDIGDRVVGSDILTIRFLDPAMGWSLETPGGSHAVTHADGTLDRIMLHPATGEPALPAAGIGSLLLLATCSDGVIFTATGSSTSALVPATSNFTTPPAFADAAGLKLFDMATAYRTITYFLKVVAMADGTHTGALIRRNDGRNEEVVRGIERLDFHYIVPDRLGKIRRLNAAQVDTQVNGTLACPIHVRLPAQPGNSRGCLWRNVRGIEIDLLASGIVPSHALNDTQTAYSYAGDAPPSPPRDHSIRPGADQGFPQALIRRESVAIVPVTINLP